MNVHQELWWRQAESDLAVFRLLRERGVAPCHLLHYLQMLSEKLGKAYHWRSGSPPPKSHAGFVQFLRFLGGVRSSERSKVAEAFDFSRFDDFRNWVRTVLPMAYDLERLAPDLAQENAPNPEYPWPHTAPEYTPVTYEFQLWKELTESGRGRQFLQLVEIAVERFAAYG